MLKKVGLWENVFYFECKNELGIFIEDVREFFLNCVVVDVCKRWFNFFDILYKGYVLLL